MVLAGCLCALAGVGIPVVAASAATAREVHVGSAPVLPPGARAVGALAAPTRLSVAVTLQPRDPAALTAYATAVATPGSAVYHQYLTVAEFAYRFGPTAAQIDAVASALRSQGLDPGAVSPNGLSIPVTATAGALARAFSIGFHRVALSNGSSAFANTAAPSLAANVAGDVQGVVGLDTLDLPHPVSLVRSASHSASAAAPDVVTGGPQPCATAKTEATDEHAYTADELASAYGFSSLYGAGDEGAGQTVALYELEPNLTSDIAAYQSCYATSAKVSYMTVDGGATGAPAGTGEAALDIEDVIGLAPKANIIVYQGPNTGAGGYETYSKIVNDNTAKVISTSWGACEADETTSQAEAENVLFEQAATLGQTIVAASGDDGSEDCGSGALAVDDPGSQPYVTSVGGTSLTALGPPPTETVWNGTCTASGGGTQPCGGGGGVSSLWPMPNYQSGSSTMLHVINTEYSSGVPCGASSGNYCREVPDVSADADPGTGYLIYYDGTGVDTDAAGWSRIGGTSASAPLWAAFVALVNASASPGCDGTPLGFLNPALYKAAGSAFSGTAYSADFNDVISGNNDITGTNGGLFPAGPGYDMASGLGTPNGASLPAALCSDDTDRSNAVMVEDPGNQTTEVGTPVSLQVQPINSALSYTASGLPAGLSISTGGVISGTPTATGTSTTTVMAYDATTQAFGDATFTWTVTPHTVTVTNPGTQTTTVGARVSLQMTGTDSGGAPLSYSAIGLPPGVSIGSSGLITGSPTNVGSSVAIVSASDASGGSGSVAFVWNVNSGPRNTVTVANPGSQTTTVGKAVALRVTATDSGGAHVTFSATRLPAGLSISADGLVSGIPTTVGSQATTLTASDSTGGSGSASFTWTIGAASRGSGAPGAKLSRASLSGVGKGKPKLTFEVSAASGYPAVARIVIAAPKGLSFSRRAKRLARGITLTGARGKRLRFTASVSHGALTLKLSSPESSVGVTITRVELSASKSLERKVAHHSVKTVSLTLSAINSAHDTIRLAVKLRV